MILRAFLYKIVYDKSAPHPTWLLLLKVKNASWANTATFITNRAEMWPISITNATGFADILQKYVNSAHFDQKLFDNLLWNHLAKLYQTLLGWSHLKNVVAPPSIQTGWFSQIINFFNWLFQLYCKSKWTKILTASCMAMSN